MRWPEKASQIKELRWSLNAGTGGGRALLCNHWFLCLGLFFFLTCGILKVGTRFYSSLCLQAQYSAKYPLDLTGWMGGGGDGWVVGWLAGRWVAKWMDE